MGKPGNVETYYVLISYFTIPEHSETCIPVSSYQANLGENALWDLVSARLELNIAA